MASRRNLQTKLSQAKRNLGSAEAQLLTLRMSGAEVNDAIQRVNTAREHVLRLTSAIRESRARYHSRRRGK